MSLADKFRNLGRFLGQDVSENEEIKIFEYKSVKVFGSEREIAQGHLPDEMIRQLAEHMGVSESEIRRFLGSEHAGQDITETLQRLMSSAKQDVHADGPIVRVQCPDCNRTVVNRKGYCMYCGAVFADAHAETAEEQAPRTTAEDVDAKYLNEDVESASPKDDDHEDDSFMQRLTRM